MAEITQAFLNETFSYDGETGLLTWKARPREHFSSERSWKGANVQCEGKVAASTGKFGVNIYRIVRVDHVLFLQHRLVWMLVHGHWPSVLLDHENGDGTDNRIRNLREATFTQNHANRKYQGKNPSGLKGAFFHKKGQRWTSRIGVNGELLHLGMFDTPEEAHAAYMVAAEKHFGEFARAS